MKRKVFLIITILLLITGCSEKKFYLEDNLYEKSAITEITAEDLKTMEKDGKNFVVSVYLPGCTSCAEFRVVLNEYMENHSLEFYTISILDVEDTLIKEKVEYAPSLVIYKKGKIVAALDATSDKDKPALTSKDGLEEWIEKYIYTTK